MDLDTFLRGGSMSAASLADKTKLSAASIARIRRGQQNLTIDMIGAIVRETGGKVTAEDLLRSREAA